MKTKLNIPVEELDGVKFTMNDNTLLFPHSIGTKRIKSFTAFKGTFCGSNKKIHKKLLKIS